jgi:hypothetical protein
MGYVGPYCRRPANHPPREGQRVGMTLVAAILSLLLLLLLAALVASAVWTARGAAKRAACKGNLQSLVRALLMYREDNGDFPPDHYEIPGDGVTSAHLVVWRDLIRREVTVEHAFVCPGDEAACAAEESRPPESRSGATSCSYDYVYWQPFQAAASGGGRAGEAAGRAPFAESEREGPAPLLVCRHHYTSDEEGAPWGLVAYEDGSIVWEQIPRSLRRRLSSPAAAGPETGPMTASEAAPPWARGGSSRASPRRTAAESTALAPGDSGPASRARRGARESRRPR